MAGRFAGKTVLVTGGAAGLGRAHALAFAREGAHIVLADINEAGIQSIIHAHPFPPLPADMSGELVDVHVRMRTGVRVTPGDVETTVEKKSVKKSSATKSQSQH